MGYIGRDNSLSTFTKQSITADGGTSFTLNQGVGDSSSILVSIGGIVQQPDVAYTASGTALVFTSAPTNAYPIWVVYLGKELTISSETGLDEVDTQAGVGNGSATPITLVNSVSSVNDIIVTLNGIAQKPSTDYTVSGTTLTFTTAPSSAMNILVYYLSLSGAANTPGNGSVSTASQFVSSGTWPAWNGSNLINTGGDATQADIDELIASLATLSFLQNIDHSTALLNMVNGWSDTLTTENSINPFNGVSAVSALSDHSSGGHSVNATGTVTVTTGSKKVGTHGIDFNTATNGYLTVPAHADFNFGTGDFEMSAWIYQKTRCSNENPIIANRNGSGTSTNDFMLLTHGGDSKLKLNDSGVQLMASNTTIPLNTWVHIMCSRVSGTLRLFKDGVQVASTTTARDFNETNPLNFGYDTIGTPHGSNCGGNANMFDGYMDEILIKKGSGTSSNFTPTTSAHTADSNTVLLLHGEAISAVANTGSSTLIYSSNSYTNSDELVFDYSDSNRNTSHNVGDGSKIKMGFAVTLSAATVISRVSYNLHTFGSPTGNCWVEVMGVASGTTVDSNANGDDIVITRSNERTMSSINAVPAARNDFDFSNPAILPAGNYCFILTTSIQNGSNYLRMGLHNGGTTNCTWKTSGGTWDDGFRVCGGLYGNKNLDIKTKGTNDLATTDSPASAPAKGHIEALVDTTSHPQLQVAQNLGTIIASTSPITPTTGGLLFDGNRTGTNYSGAGANDYAGKDWGVGVTKTITGFKAWNNENTYGFNVGGSNIEAKLQGSSDGTSWTDLGTTGSVADGAGQPTPFMVGKMSGITTTTAYRYHRVLFNNTTDIRWNEIEFYETNEVSIVSLNTDVIGEMSRDGGTTWSPATLARSSTGIDGATSEILSGDVDFTGDPSGTNVVGRIRTVNKHKVTVDGISVNWS